MTTINKHGVGVVAVDFDGTLTHENNYPSVEGLNYEAIEILKEFRTRGGKLILWTLRTNGHLKAAVDALRSEGLEFDAVNENVRECKESWLRDNPECGVSKKAFADLYIDDRDPRSLVYGIDWKLIRELLLGRD